MTTRNHWHELVIEQEALRDWPFNVKEDRLEWLSAATDRLIDIIAAAHVASLDVVFFKASSNLMSSIRGAVQMEERRRKETAKAKAPPTKSVRAVIMSSNEAFITFRDEFGATMQFHSSSWWGLPYEGRAVNTDIEVVYYLTGNPTEPVRFLGARPWVG